MLEISIAAQAGGDSQAVAISGTSAQSAVIAAEQVLLFTTADMFMRQGGNPTALSDGTDQFVPAGVFLRVNVSAGNKLAFKTTSATGTVYLTPRA